METNISMLTNKVVGIVVAVIITVLVLVPLSHLGGEEVSEQPGVRMALADNLSDKTFSDEYDAGTPILISDAFSITYDTEYVITGKGINVSADSVSVTKSGNDVTVTYMIDDTEHEYYATVAWLFVNDANGTYSATDMAQNINVNESNNDKVYVVGSGQFDTFWSYGNDETKVVRT